MASNTNNGNGNNNSYKYFKEVILIFSIMVLFLLIANKLSYDISTTKTHNQTIFDSFHVYYVDTDLEISNLSGRVYTFDNSQPFNKSNISEIFDVKNPNEFNIDVTIKNTEDNKYKYIEIITAFIDKNNYTLHIDTTSINYLIPCKSKTFTININNTMFNLDRIDKMDFIVYTVTENNYDFFDYLSNTG